MIGRKKEIHELEDLYESDRPELVAVYGRRRVGKTYLIDELFLQRYAFQHTAISPAGDQKNGMLKMQLDHFYISLQKYGLKGEKKPRSWLEAFYLLEKLLDSREQHERLVVFIDELPWLDTPRSDFLKAFEAFWNSWGCRKKNLMLIVCGSASSWILDNLINNHGGLYNRVTYEIHLLPFTLGECEDFLEDRNISLSRYDIAQCYMALGGIPYYLGYIRRNLSFAQNMDALFYHRDGKLKEEFDRLFESIFNNPQLMKSIVIALFAKNMGYTRSELLGKLKMKDGETFTKCLKALIASQFVEKYIPFGEKENCWHYRLADPFCQFFLRFVMDSPNEEEDHWSQILNSQPVVTWRGLAFENVCRNHIPQIKKALGISGVSVRASGWIKSAEESEGTQIDLILLRRDNIVNICEIKYYHDQFQVDNDYHRILLRRAGLLAEQLPPVFSVHNTLITTFGLKPGKYSSVFTDVITLDDLFEN